MTYPDISRDPPRDPELAGWLNTANGRDGDERVDLGSLRSTVLASARLPLARLRSQLPWWEVAAAWARPALPLALAAGLAMIWLVGSLPIGELSPSVNPTAYAPPFLEEVLTSRLPDAEYDLLVSGDAEMEALVNFAFQEM